MFFFFKQKTAYEMRISDWSSDVCSSDLVDHIALLRQALQYVQRRHPFTIDAMVVLPDHLHAVWTLPPGDAGYAMRWRQIKGWFSRHEIGRASCRERVCQYV